MAKARDTSTYEMPNRDDLAMETEVLVELDGPRVVLFRSPSVDRLGIVIDPGADPEIWILSAVSRMELEEIARGTLPVRDVFSQKETLRWLELDPKGKAKRARTISLSEVPAGILPVRGAPLPDTSRPRLAKLVRLRETQKSNRRIRLDGEVARDNRIAFSALAQITQTLQNLWTSIGETLGIGGDPSQPLASTLVAAGAGSGSFVLNLHAPDEGAFQKVLLDYQRLLRGAYDEDARVLAEVAANSRLAGALDAYLKTLETWKAEAVVEAPGRRAYVGCSSARALRAALKSGLAREGAPDDKETVTKRTVLGHFVAFDMDGSSFSFKDIHADETISGRIAPGVIRAMSAKGGKEASVGNRTRYAAVVEERSGKLSLTEFTLAQGELGET